jgi:hypothetical protein
MARSPVEIQADMALTRRVIEHQLDALTPRVSRAWRTPWITGAGALAVGFLLSRVPLGRVLRVGARAVQTATAVAGAVAAIEHFLPGRRRPAA